MEMDMEMEMGVHKLTREIVRQQHRRQRVDVREGRNEIGIVFLQKRERNDGVVRRWGSPEPRDVD